VWTAGSLLLSEDPFVFDANVVRALGWNIAEIGFSVEMGDVVDTVGTSNKADVCKIPGEENVAAGYTILVATEADILSNGEVKKETSNSHYE